MGTVGWIVVGLVCVVVGLVGVVVLVGVALPRDHVASARAVIPASEDEVWRAITGFEEMASWRRGVKRVERGEDVGGRPVWIEHSGGGPMALAVEERVEGERLVLRIADERLPFGGTWTYEASPAEGGARLRITEDGFVKNPIFRFVSRLVMGHHATMTRYLEDLGRKFGGEVEVVREEAT